MVNLSISFRTGYLGRATLVWLLCISNSMPLAGRNLLFWRLIICFSHKQKNIRESAEKKEKIHTKKKKGSTSVYVLLFNVGWYINTSRLQGKYRFWMVDSCKNIDFENLLGSKLVWSKYAQTCVWSKDASSITTTIVNTQQKKKFHQN